MRFIKTRIKRNFFSFNPKSCQACHTFSRRLAEPVGAEAGMQGQNGRGGIWIQQLLAAIASIAQISSISKPNTSRIVKMQAMASGKR